MQRDFQIVQFENITLFLRYSSHESLKRPILNSRAFIAWEQSIKPLMIIVNWRINTSIFLTCRLIHNKQGRKTVPRPTYISPKHTLYLEWDGEEKERKNSVTLNRVAKEFTFEIVMFL